MSAIQLSADMSGLEQLLANASRPLDMRPAWKKLTALYVEREKAQFASQPWKKLSKRYARDKAKQYPGMSILHRTGALLAGVTKPQVDDLSRDTAVIGIRTGAGRSALYYAQFAQEGRGEPKRTVVPRLTAAEREEWLEVIRQEAFRQLLGGKK